MKKIVKKPRETFEYQVENQSITNIFRKEMKVIKEQNRKNKLVQQHQS